MNINSIKPINFKGTIIVPIEFGINGEPKTNLNTDYIKKIEEIPNAVSTAIVTYNESPSINKPSHDKKYHKIPEPIFPKADSVFIAKCNAKTIIEAYKEVKDSNRTIDLTK